MTDEEILILKNALKTNVVVWRDINETNQLHIISSIRDGDKVWGIEETGPEPCECAILEGMRKYICLDNVELEEFFVLQNMQE